MVPVLLWCPLGPVSCLHCCVGLPFRCARERAAFSVPTVRSSNGPALFAFLLSRPPVLFPWLPPALGIRFHSSFTGRLFCRGRMFFCVVSVTVAFTAVVGMVKGRQRANLLSRCARCSALVECVVSST
eukprot:5769253-Prymnesium_polylepis.1